MAHAPGYSRIKGTEQYTVVKLKNKSGVLLSDADISGPLLLADDDSQAKRKVRVRLRFQTNDRYWFYLCLPQSSRKSGLPLYG